MAWSLTGAQLSLLQQSENLMVCQNDQLRSLEAPLQRNGPHAGFLTPGGGAWEEVKVATENTLFGWKRLHRLPSFCNVNIYLAAALPGVEELSLLLLQRRCSFSPHERFAVNDLAESECGIKRSKINIKTAEHEKLNTS
ncbi:hypothetical protein JOB18_049386 [Solea senegalensis]|uniref:Uncharacterized protein n=1 Tax=Solea senegalensis TaxID=28829 RepID=A0AAV6SNM2_SOLSE|nr:hypothetical protein JOB18_049386 [Solea senegalensis]